MSAIEVLKTEVGLAKREVVELEAVVPDGARIIIARERLDAFHKALLALEQKDVCEVCNDEKASCLNICAECLGESYNKEKKQGALDLLKKVKININKLYSQEPMYYNGGKVIFLNEIGLTLECIKKELEEGVEK